MLARRVGSQPERDLWDLGGDDASLLDYYSAATGIKIDDGALLMERS
jgi:hypothetical protein